MNSSPNKLTPVILSAMMMTFISMMPVLNLVNLLCCAGIMIGAFIGVYSYSRQLVNTNVLLEQKDAIMIGLLSGIISAIVQTGIELAVSLFSKSNPMAEAMDALSSVGRDIPPEVMQILDKFSSEFSEYGYSPTFTIITLVIRLVMLPLFGMLGGFIAFSILKKKNNNNINNSIQP